MKLVSAILPTRGRQEWAKQAAELFHAQTYPTKELIVLDDEEEPSFPNAKPDCATYLRIAARSIGQKRNYCCRLAIGDIIMHWDSDDWYAPERMKEQVWQLEESGKQVVGYNRVLFYDDRPNVHDKYLRYFESAQWTVGASLTYTKSWWAKNRFPESKQFNTGEDQDMCRTARESGQLATFDGRKMMVARIHAGNTARKNPDHRRQWTCVTRADFPDEFFQ